MIAELQKWQGRTETLQDDITAARVCAVAATLDRDDPQPVHGPLIATLLVDLHGGQVLRTREALEALPGVGRKTANVVLNVAFVEATMAVETHTFRVGNRTGLAPGRNPYEVEMGLMKRIPPDYLVDAHHWLILQGRYVCIARKPLCYKCAVAVYCDFKPKTPAP
jgi:endonuclease-3